MMNTHPPLAPLNLEFNDHPNQCAGVSIQVVADDEIVVAVTSTHADLATLHLTPEEVKRLVTALIDQYEQTNDPKKPWTTREFPGLERL